MSYWGQSDCDRRLRQSLEDERYARERAEDLLRQEQEARFRDSEEARRARREMHEQQWNNEMRTASTWPETLRKQAALHRAEAYLDDDNDDVGRYFTNVTITCNRALELWNEEEAKIADQVAALLARVAELHDGVRFAVADHLDGEGMDSGVAAMLRDTPEDADELSAWLNW